jgi:hypothetical protein
MFLLAILFLYTPLPVLAHEVLANDEVKLTVHIDPGDNPQAGQKALLFFEFQRKNEDFKGQDCDCHFTLQKDGQTLLAGSLFREHGGNTTSIPYVFPDPGIYHLITKGQAKPGADLPTFTFTQDIEIDAEKTHHDSSSWLHHAHHIIPMAGLLGLCGYLIFQKKRKIGNDDNKRD